MAPWPVVARGDRSVARSLSNEWGQVRRVLDGELNNRPDWVRNPLQGIQALVEPGEAVPEKGSFVAR